MRGKTITGEFSRLRRDGAIGYHSLSANPVLDGDRVIGLEGFLIDVTERKRAEERLRESADRLALILEATSGGVWDWNIPSGHAVFSPRYSTMLGYEPEEFAKSYASWRSLVHPDDFERVNQHHADHFAGHTDFSIEFRMREKSGNWHWIHSRGLLIERDAEGRPVRMVGTHSDIQERKRAEEALRQSEERHRAILQTAMDGFWVADRRQRLLEVNESYCRMSGYSAEELLAMRISDLEAEETARETAGHIQRLVAQGESSFRVPTPPQGWDHF